LDRHKESIMKAKQLFTLTALAVAGCAVFADEAPNGPLPRAAVVQSVLEARAAGTLQPNGQGPTVPGYPQTGAPASTLTRTEVGSEVAQARAAGTLQPIGQASAQDEYALAGNAVSTLTRAQVQEQVLAARAIGELTPAGQADLTMEHGVQPARTATLSSGKLLAWWTKTPHVIGAGR
jgi:hypothetical protein